MRVPTPNVTKQIVWHQKFMPVKYVNPETGKFLPGALENTGAPSAYGINTPAKLVETSLSSDTNRSHKGSKIQKKSTLRKTVAKKGGKLS